MRNSVTLALIAGLAGAVSNSPAVGATYGNQKVTELEVAQLPKFCWRGLQVPNATGPEFDIPISDCGYGMNHYCSGLVNLIRARGAAAKGAPVGFLQRALTDIRYTEDAMKSYPQCPVRGHVENSKAEVERLIKLYGKHR